MDGFELLLQASDPNNNFEGDLTLSPNKSTITSSGKIHSDLLDPIDSIMMLAEQAVKQENELSNNSSPPQSWNDYGPYFNGFNVDRRMRAMSEPWTTQDSMNVSLKYGLIGAANAFLGLEGSSGKSNNSSNLSTNFGNLASHSGPSGHQQQLEQALPHMLDKYAAIYNKHGRVGIYTKEERIAIVSRFHEKRKRRVWRKKIRYFCRKNLADRRVRVKGRFVKAGGKTSSFDGEEGEEARLMIKLKRGVAGLTPMEEVDPEEDEGDYEYAEQDDVSDEGLSSGGNKSDSNTTNSSHSEEQGSTPPSGSVTDSNCKSHFLSSMLGDYIENELNSTTNTASAEEFGPGGKRMRRHSIAY